MSDKKGSSTDISNTCENEASEELETEVNNNFKIGIPKSVERFLERALGPSSKAIGGLLLDQCKYWRAMNLDRLAKKYENICKERDIHPDAKKHLPFSHAYKVTEAVSVEEDEKVQDLWAELLASATDPSRSVEVKKVYIDTLKSLSAVEVSLLELIWFAEGEIIVPNDLQSFEKKFNDMAEISWRQFPQEERDTAIQNLVRLRCLAFRIQPPEIGTLFGNLHDQRGMPTHSRFALVNPEAFQSLLQYIENILLVSIGVKTDTNKTIGIQMGHSFMGSRRIKAPELNYMLR